MNAYDVITSTRFHDREARRLSVIAGVAYGLVYSLAFGLTLWGYDARMLAQGRAEMAWTKLTVGLPLLAFLGAIAGYVAGRRGKAGVWVGVWTVCGVLIGIVAGGTPYAGYNLATWVTEPRLRGMDIYPFEPAAAARMVFLAAITGGVGTVVGLVGRLLMEKAWDLAAPGGRMSPRSWAVLLLCTPLAILPGVAADEIINSELRTRQLVVYEIISADPEQGVSHGNVDPYRDRFSDDFGLHLAGYDLEGQGTVVDVAFDNGFVVRCTVYGQALAGCPPISPWFEAWMDALIQDGLGEGQGTALESHANRVSVDSATVDWLASQGNRTSEDYEIARDTQHGGWVIMSARFSTDQVLACYFRGSSPVVLDRCGWQR